MRQCDDTDLQQNKSVSPAQPGLCTACICGSAFTCASLLSLTRALAKGLSLFARKAHANVELKMFS